MKRLLVLLLLYMILPASCSVQASAAEGRYTGEVVAKWLPNGRDMQLTESLGYIDGHGTDWRVPAGTIVDGASIPRPLWGVVGPPFTGKYRKASVVHDYFCQRMSRPWQDVHGVLFEASLAEGNSLYHARLMYGAVYAWGPRWEIQNGKPVRTRDVARAPTGPDLQELADWVKGGDRSLAEIAAFAERRFPRTNPTTDKRVALVIGNSAYQHTPKLDNPRNDASDIKAVLRKSRFQVIDGLDLDKMAFDQKIREFSAALAGAEVGPFFYAGHGLQVSGKNYLVPIDAKLESAASLDFEMVALDLVHRTMERQTTTNILFLDACQNNPLARNLARAMGTRSAEIARGLAAVESGVGTLISFSTQPGNVALDGTGRNSPFAGALTKHISTSKDDLGAILIAVRNDVMKETQRKQVPWEHSALTGRFYFGAPPPLVASPDRIELERAATFIRETEDQARLEAFIARFGETPYAEMARARLQELRKKQDAALVRPPPSRAEKKREHAFDGTWEVTGTPDNCPAKPKSWKWRHALRISGSEIIVARGFIGKFGTVSADGNFKFSVQGSPPQLGNFSGKLQADSGQGRYKYPDCSGPARDECCSGTLTLSRPRPEQAFDGIWEVNGLNDASCPKPGRKWKALKMQVSGPQIIVDGSVVGRVRENGDFEYTRPLSERPTVRRTFIGTLQTESGRGTFEHSVGACRGTISLKRL